jgi:hypothetical protein
MRGARHPGKQAMMVVETIFKPGRESGSELRMVNIHADGKIVTEWLQE